LHVAQNHFFSNKKVDQNISNARDEKSRAWRSNVQHGVVEFIQLVQHVHRTSLGSYAQLRADQINIHGVGCLCPLFLALSPLR